MRTFVSKIPNPALSGCGKKTTPTNHKTHKLSWHNTHTTYSSPHPPLAPSTLQSHPSRRVKETFVQLCSPNIPLRLGDYTDSRHNCWMSRLNFRVWILNPGALPISPPHAPSLSVCLFLWVCVVCVCFLLYLSLYMCFASCVFCVWFCIHNHIFVVFLLCLHLSSVVKSAGLNTFGYL